MHVDSQVCDKYVLLPNYFLLLFVSIHLFSPTLGPRAHTEVGIIAAQK